MRQQYSPQPDCVQRHDRQSGPGEGEHAEAHGAKLGDDGPSTEFNATTCPGISALLTTPRP